MKITQKYLAILKYVASIILQSIIPTNRRKMNANSPGRGSSHKQKLKIDLSPKHREVHLCDWDLCAILQPRVAFYKTQNIENETQLLLQ